MNPLRFSLTLLFFSLIPLYGGDIPLTELTRKADAQLRWNPYRNRGLIFKEDTVLSLMVDSDIAIINNSRIISGVNLYIKDSDIYISDESSRILYKELSKFMEYEEMVNDNDLYRIPVIILDPGHGGKDPGAIGNYDEFQINEKDVVLKVSQMVSKMLQERYSHKKILLTRNDDRFLTLEERVEIANGIEIDNKEAVLYISIHANASLNKKATGFEVWYLPKDYRREVLTTTLPSKHNSIVNALKEDELSLEGEELAQSILDGMAAKVEDVSPNRGLKEEIWFVVRKARMASILIELGFVTNEIEGGRLNDPIYLKKLSQGIYNGIVNYIASYEGDGR